MSVLASIKVNPEILPSRYKFILFQSTSLPATVQFVPLNFEDKFATSKLIRKILIFFLSSVNLAIFLDFWQKISPPRLLTFLVSFWFLSLLLIGYLIFSLHSIKARQQTFLSSRYRYGLYLFKDALLLYEDETTCSWWNREAIIDIKSISTGHKPATFNILIRYNEKANGEIKFFYLPPSLQHYGYNLKKIILDWQNNLRK